jgi:hypothetical protein
MFSFTIHTNLVTVVLVTLALRSVARAAFRHAYHYPHGLVDRIFTRFVMAPLYIWTIQRREEIEESEK